MVLLAEPDPSVSGLVESLLGSFGCQVIARPVASEALDYAAHNDVDLVIAGTHPAQISDIYFIEEIRKRRPALPAIVMSEFASPPPPTDDGRAPTEFLNKPFAMADLAAMVRRLLAK